ncbi:hypothetical protein [uncultured Tenacibaculum sp.]|uniref:hypothetical protein n=1 Tax=uncultured Tenacibaculum sp. TaxID=174713 RepID=UPI00262888AE|nr:hypothetical protein [uncultured Tenacibaculum sp.]
MRKITFITVIIIIVMNFSNCYVRNVQNNEYSELVYKPLDNNINASAEVLNQINFIERQLKRKLDGRNYINYGVVENIIILSKIETKITALGTFGNSYEITKESLSKWKKWYKNNSKYFFFRNEGNDKFLGIKYPNGEKIVLIDK